MSDNTASEGSGGAISNYEGGVTLTDSTLSATTAPVGDGGGIWNDGTTTLVATIVANSGTGLDCVTTDESATTDGGYNADDDGSCGLSAANHSISDSSTLDLGALANNGGPTETVLPVGHQLGGRSDPARHHIERRRDLPVCGPAWGGEQR